jgi:hypothetical protein
MEGYYRKKMESAENQFHELSMLLYPFIYAKIVQWHKPSHRSHTVNRLHRFELNHQVTVLIPSFVTLSLAGASPFTTRPHLTPTKFSTFTTG